MRGKKKKGTMVKPGAEDAAAQALMEKFKAQSSGNHPIDQTE